MKTHCSTNLQEKLVRILTRINKERQNLQK